MSIGAALTLAFVAAVQYSDRKKVTPEPAPERTYYVTYEVPPWPPCSPCKTEYESRVVDAKELGELLEKQGKWIQNLEIHPRNFRD